MISIKIERLNKKNEALIKKLENCTNETFDWSNKKKD